jgi:hypothetical protein
MYTNGGGLPYKRGKDGDFIFLNDSQNPVTELAEKITGKIYAAITARKKRDPSLESLELTNVPNP